MMGEVAWPEANAAPADRALLPAASQLADKDPSFLPKFLI